MIFSDRTYSVLIVSSVPKLKDALIQMLPGTRYDPLCFQRDAGAARRELVQRNFDIIIINSPLPDDFGTKLALDAMEKAGTLVLMLLSAEQMAEQQVLLSSKGIFALGKPFSRSSFEQALSWLCTGRERLRRLETKASTMEGKMEEIRLVNRAKCLLIEQLQMTEVTAHHHIEKQAMDRCISRREVALGIIHTYG